MSSLPEEVLSSLEGLDLDDLRQVSRHLPCGRFRLSRRKKPTVAARVAAQILSIDTWRSLPESDRKQLEALLPKSASAVDDPEEAFLSGGAFAPFNIFFGTPLSRFHKALEAGDFSAAANKAAEHEEALRLQDMTQHRREHHNGMVHRLHYLKRTWVPPMPRLSGLPRSSGSGRGGSEQLMYSKESGGLVRRSKTGGVGVPLGRPCLGECRGGGTTAFSVSAVSAAGAAVAAGGGVAGEPPVGRGPGHTLSSPGSAAARAGAVGSDALAEARPSEPFMRSCRSMCSARATLASRTPLKCCTPRVVSYPCNIKRVYYTNNVTVPVTTEIIGQNDHERSPRYRETPRRLVLFPVGLIYCRYGTVGHNSFMNSMVANTAGTGAELHPPARRSCTHPRGGAAPTREAELHPHASPCAASHLRPVTRLWWIAAGPGKCIKEKEEVNHLNVTVYVPSERSIRLLK